MKSRKQKKPGSRGKGVRTLRKLADEMIDEKGLVLATKLLTDAEGGRLPSFQMLVKLADGAEEVEEPELLQSLLSLARGLAAEPEWKGPQSSATPRKDANDILP